MCQFTAASLVISGSVGIIYFEDVWKSYFGTALIALLVAAAFRVLGRGRFPVDRLTRREGFLAVVVSWCVIVFFGAMPFWVSGSIPHLADAIFESASGFTTTGATILTDIEAMPHAHLFQRSLAHWIGGMGIIVLSVAILPELAIGGMQLFAAESSGISMDKISPRIVETARRLWWVYVGMTVVLVVLLLFGGMGVFDAITHAFGTLATGGFSTRNASVGAFNSVYIEVVITIFMLASGMSFALHYRLFVRGELRALLRSSEAALYFSIFAVVTLGIAWNLVSRGGYTEFSQALRESSFQTASILTTTGFGTADFDRWPDLSRYLLVLMMFCGGCAGSTAGGVKVVRLVVVLKHAALELKKLIYPRIVRPIRLDGVSVTQSTIQGILGFFLLYVTTIAVATTLVLATGVDLVTGVTAVISAMNSIGPGLAMVGPAQNYAALPDMCKWVLSICMIVGRLEIYTVLVLFSVSFWRH